MLTWPQGVGFALGVLSLAGSSYALAAIWAARRFRRDTAADPAAPSLSLLKPLHGEEPGLRENLESFCLQDYGGSVQIVFGVQDPNDPAIAVVGELKRAHPARDIALVIDSTLHGSNRKVSNLINILPQAKHDTLVLSDSDIRVTPDYLSAIAGALGGGGAVSCLYTGTDIGNPWSRLVAMGINYQFIPNVLFATASGLDAPCFGSTIALSRALLARIGGPEAFKDLLADDYEIGRAVRNCAERTRLAPVVVAHICGETNAGEMIAHELRWARTIRLINWAGHWGSLVTHAMPLALIGLALAPGAFTLTVLALALSARAAVKLNMDKVLGTSAGPLYLLPLRDLLSFAIFLGSLYGGSVRWRGRRFAVAPDGVLSQ